MYPGILVQMITTKRPDDDMIEVAITSMQQALVADGNEVPAGSTDFERSTMDFGPKPDPDDPMASSPTASAPMAGAPPTAPSATADAATAADADEPPAIA